MNFNFGNGGGNPIVVNKPKIKKYVIIVLVVAALVAIVSTGWYTVNDKQVAVITTFGKVTGTAEAGMHFKLPLGIQKVELVDVNVYHKIELGYRTDGSNLDYKTIENESKMISGDFNIVNVDFFVEYKISDPVKYLYASKNPGEVLKNLVQSQVRNVIGSKYVDNILTTGKTEIQNEVKELVTLELEAYDIGVMLTDIKIQDAEPPTEEVRAAFKNVETAKQVGETAKNDATAYKNAELPRAEAEANQLTQNAEYLKTDRINEAKKQVAMFEAMYSEYVLNTEITKSRMYFEAIEAVLPGVKVIINTSGDGTTEYMLPLDSFAQVN